MILSLYMNKCLRIKNYIKKLLNIIMVYGINYVKKHKQHGINKQLKEYGQYVKKYG